MIIDGFEVYITCGGTRLQEATEEQDKSVSVVCNIEDLADKDFSVCVNDLQPHKKRFQGYTVTVFAEGRKVAWDATERGKDFNPLTLDRGLDEERKERRLRFTMPRVSHGSGDDEPHGDQLGLLRVLVHRAKFKSHETKGKPDPLSIDKRPIVHKEHDLSVRAHRQCFSTVTLGAIIEPQSEDFKAFYDEKINKWQWMYFTTGDLIGTFDFRHESQRAGSEAGSEHNFADEMDFRADEQPTHLEDEEWLDQDMRTNSDHSHSESAPFGGSPRRSLSPLEADPDPYTMDVDERELFAPAHTSTPRTPPSSSSLPLDESDLDARPEREEDADDSDVEIEDDEHDLFAPTQSPPPRSPSLMSCGDGNADGRPEREEDDGDSDNETEDDERDLCAPAQASTAKTPPTPSSPLDESDVYVGPERKEDGGDGDIELDQIDVGVEPDIVPVPNLDAPDELTASVKLKTLYAKRAFLKAEMAYKKSRREFERVNLEIAVAEEL
ncbi:hypothetical protein PENSPDRAFT_747273 [Peniophora sp. CONT]|nr:hypothetical protein PENSPDRAFT_747273 [Peniophora sp. CONT]